MDDPSDGTWDCLAEAGYVGGVEGVVAFLLWWIGLCERRGWDRVWLSVDVDCVV